MADSPRLMIVLIASLFITSMLISFFVMSVYGYSVLPFELPNMDMDTGSTSSNFVTSCNLTPYTQAGSWTCEAGGAQTLGGGSLTLPATDAERKEGVHKNTYRVTPSGGDYSITLAKGLIWGSTLLEVKSDGIHIANYASAINYPIGDALYVPLEGANTQEATITTIYDSVTPQISFTFNGQSYTLEKDKTPNTMTMFIDSYAGISTTGNLLVSSMGSGFNRTGGDVVDGLMMVLGFIGNVLTIIVWNIDSNIFPWELNLIFIKTQELGIFISAIYLGRS